MLLIIISSDSIGVYTSWRGRSRLNLFGRVLMAWIIAFGVLLGLIVFSHQGSYFSRIWLMSWVALGITGALAFRVIVYYWIGRLREKGLNHKRIVIVGTGSLVTDVVGQLSRSAWIGLDIDCIVPNGKPYDDDALSGIPVRGSMAELPQMVVDRNVQEVWICLPLREGDVVNEILYLLRHNTVNIRFVPDLSDLRMMNHKSSQIAGIDTIDLSCSPLDGPSSFVKDLEDRVLGFVIFTMMLPVICVIAIAVKLSSPGPILFKQYRHGLDGRRINVYKFRTMKVHKEEEGQITQASQNDNRVTKIGGFLRKTSLDELPQFFNVIQGKMSIVGPRPHAIAHNEHYKELVESYMKRHKVKPGITGWAQVNGYRGETDTVDKMKKRVEYDLFYIENWSLMFDLKIIFLTMFKGFVHKNAY